MVVINHILCNFKFKFCGIFVSFISNNGYNMYWDTARNKKIILMPPTDEIKPSEEKWHGSTPYIEVSIKFQAITGFAQNVV